MNSKVFRLILSDWAKEQFPERRKVLEGTFSADQLADYNLEYYNIYTFPNYPRQHEGTKPVDGTDIDVFEWVFVDMDLKENIYATKEEFIDVLHRGISPSLVVDSGNGIHAYWRIVDLDARTYLRLQRRLIRHLHTDEAVSKICQLMRMPGYANTKSPGDFKLCDIIEKTDNEYTCEQLDKWLPKLTKEDSDYCDQHYNKTHSKNEPAQTVDERLPVKFARLIGENQEAKELFAGSQSDRSKADFRLAHILFTNAFTKDEAMSVLVNCAKALERAPRHRVEYASKMIDKVWVAESLEDMPLLSNSVMDILSKTDAMEGERFPCWQVFDGTKHGFRLGEVLGLIGGSGSGKTTLALNYFYHFCKQNPDYIHLFVSLEQPEREIALRWSRLVGTNDRLNHKVHVLGNYNEDGTSRSLSLTQIEQYVKVLEKKTGVKVGCLVIDHIGALKKSGANEESQRLIDICVAMKAVANSTNTFLIMQSQTSREKAGIGDLELNKDAAYGTTIFEWFCDYIVTTWQPLKRIYEQASHMTCSAFKYCKIRHKNVKLDKTKEDVVHVLMFDTETERLRQMNQLEEKAYDHWNSQAITLRNKDRKKDPTRITRINWVNDGKVDNRSN